MGSMRKKRQSQNSSAFTKGSSGKRRKTNLSPQVGFISTEIVSLLVTSVNQTNAGFSNENTKSKTHTDVAVFKYKDSTSGYRECFKGLHHDLGGRYQFGSSRVKRATRKVPCMSIPTGDNTSMIPLCVRKTFQATTPTVEKSKKRSFSIGRKTARKVFAVAAFFIITCFGLFYSNASREEAFVNSVFVEGAGFSGFWYIMGRLSRIPAPRDVDYYCFSAGCLGAVSVLRNLSIPVVMDAALLLQNQWRNGEIERYEVAPLFIDALLKDRLIEDDMKLLSRLHVITSQKHRAGYGLEAVIRTPGSIEELRTFLRQTTWIPGATGSDLWCDGHMDGAFTYAMHPRCSMHLSVFDSSVEVLLNALNVNLERRDANRFWAMGFERGVQMT